MIDLILCLFLGIILGIITGLTPGIHINLVSAFLLSSLAFFLAYFSPLSLAIFIVSMSLTHIFVDFIPSIFLGAPNEGTGLAIMPRHELLLQGKGYEAVKLSLIGALIAIFLSVLFTPLYIIYLPKVYSFLTKIMPFILILSSLFLIFHEKKSKLFAIVIFLLAGFLGISTLNLPIQQPLLPLFTGLFGSSTLIYSINKKTKIPKQTLKADINKKEFIKPIIATSISAPLCSFLPGLGSSQAAILGSELTGDMSRKQFLILIGAVNSFVMLMSFITLYVLGKSRTGAAAAIEELIQISLKDIFYILIAATIASILGFLIAIKISKIFAKNIDKINYSKISYAIIFLLVIFVILFSGFIGFLVFIISTSLGLVCNYLEIRKGHLMGCLLIPTILFYLL